MNIAKVMRNCCLALVSVALLAAAGASSAAKPATQKQFYAVVDQFVSGGTGVLVTLFVDNTATEPATINTLVVCNSANVQFVAGALDDGGPTGNAVNFTGTVGGSACTGVLIKDISGLRRGEEATYTLTANVTGGCSAPTQTVRVYASTGNTTSFTADFFATDSTGTPLAPATYAISSPVNPGCDGVIGCTAGTNVVDPTLTNPTGATSSQPLYARSIRGPQNSNDTPCLLVPYTFENRLVPTATAQGDILLRWPQDGDQRRATFFTSFNSELKPAPTDGSYPELVRRKVAWEFNGAGEPIFKTNALTCLENDFPRQYAVLQSSLAAAAQNDVTTGVVVVRGATAPEGGWKDFPPSPYPTAQFPVNIGDERVLARVTTSSATTWTLELTRGQGGTSATGAAAGKALISTPFPLGVESPYVGLPVRICIAHHGFQIYSPDGGGNPQLFEAIDYYDGDGWIGTEN